MPIHLLSGPLCGRVLVVIAGSKALHSHGGYYSATGRTDSQNLPIWSWHWANAKQPKTNPENLKR